MSRVDVVVPCYKYAHYLQGCVRSILDQQGVEVRVLIIDDCSPDHTDEVGRAIAAEDSRVEYRRHAVNQGHIATYNEGLLGWASAEYCLLLSADDMLTPGALARAAGVMDLDPDVCMTYGGEIRTADVRFDAVPPPRSFGSRVISGPEFWRLTSVEAANIVPTPTAVTRTVVQKQVGGYSKDLPHTGDLEMWLRFAAHGSIGVIDVPQGFYRIHGHNMSVAYAGLGDILQKKAAFDAAATRCAERLPDVRQFITRVDRVLAERAFWIGNRLFEAGDVAKCRACLNCAATLCPEIRRWSSWRRFRIKQMLGPSLWSAFRPLRAWVGGERPAVRTVA